MTLLRSLFGILLTPSQANRGFPFLSAAAILWLLSLGLLIWSMMLLMPFFSGGTPAFASPLMLLLPFLVTAIFIWLPLTIKTKGAVRAGDWVVAFAPIALVKAVTYLCMVMSISAFEEKESTAVAIVLSLILGLMIQSGLLQAMLSGYFRMRAGFAVLVSAPATLATECIGLGIWYLVAVHENIIWPADLFI